MPQRKQQRSMVPLSLGINLAEYGAGESEDSQSAVARPYRRLVEDGVDPGNITYVILRSAPSSQSKILGTFCETSGQRLLFFPGGRIRRLNSIFKREPTAAAQAVDGIVDHITFDSILKFFQVDSRGMFRMTSSARYFKKGVGSSRPN